MKIVIAPDKFKGSLTAPAAAAAIARGAMQARPQALLDLCPMADGGEGTVAALVAATGGTFHTRRVTGPLPEMKVDATFGIVGDGRTAVIEMAAASGLALLPPEDRNPLNTTTFGTGELIVAAAEMGVREIILGIGGSATTDAGLGCAQACGLPVILETGEAAPATEPLCGRDLRSVLMVKHGRGSPVERLRITVACDVNNPLYGPDGAAHVFAPQKGASVEEVQWLDHALRRLAERLGRTKEAEIPGAGAAGGLGFGMLAFFGATLLSGVEIVISAAKLKDRLTGAELCITGEGRFDRSSLSGKAPVGVATLCRRLGIPCFLIAGSVEPEAEGIALEMFQRVISISDGSLSGEEAIRQAGEPLAAAAARALAGETGG